MTISLNGRVAIVTGAGAGLGRTHALALAARGAKVVVNDLGAERNGDGGSPSAAEHVAQEIRANGGEAIANGASVTDETQVQAMVAATIERWGRVDILVNNAGVLRDKSFSKVSLEDFRFVLDVHLMGSVICTKAVWDVMRAQNHGRIVFTTSSSGLYGNFGQSNYAAAKMALVGLMHTLHLEGAKYGIRVNCLSPSAATRMTNDVYAEGMLQALDPALVSQGVVVLAADEAPSRLVLCAGAGVFAAAHVTMTEGVFAGDPASAADIVLARMDDVRARAGEITPPCGPQQAILEVQKAQRALLNATLAEEPS
jgi:NAD(P)-dependent dehydrogenase (short-subunit alcohol dehydrogenase family)